MRTKLRSLADAVAETVADGDTIFVGGFGQCIPFAAGHELLRSGRRDLTLCRTGADILFDQLIAAGAVRKVIFGYLGNPGIGLGHAFRRAVEQGSLDLEEWTNFSMLLRLHAGQLGVPFVPARVLLAGDVAGASADVAPVTCPYTGEELAAIPALVPDVALVHAQRADAEGNTQMWGLVGDTAVGALASRRILVTAEEIVDTDVIRADPNRTILPAHRVTAVSHVPWGAHPSYVQGYYARDDDAYHTYDELARDPDALGRWLVDVAQLPRPAYVDALGDRTATLSTRDAAPAAVAYGFPPPSEEPR
jgi:glutaconate CoA-transferase, subunit A